MADEAVREQQRPPWARRIRNERLARRWSQPEAVKALRLHSARELPSDASLLRSWKRWESGDSEPDEFYKPLIAQTFGTVTAAMFPRQSQRDVEGELLNGSGLDTVELLARVRRSDVSPATLDALKITADRLCCEYPYAAPEQLHIEGKAWLQRITGLLDQRLTLKQHREVLSLAGTVALLIGCVEYDMGQRRDSEATRQAALSLGGEAEHAGIIGWAHEMRAWYNLTQGNYPASWPLLRQALPLHRTKRSRSTCRTAGEGMGKTEGSPSGGACARKRAKAARRPAAPRRPGPPLRG